MESKYSISLSSVMKEFQLKELFLPKDANEIMITSPEVNRPGLALTGFTELFDSFRIQVIGKTEHRYLTELSDWGERVSHIHIKGTTHAGGKRWVDDPPAGMDDIKWGSVFSILYARGYNGGLSIEPHSGTWHGELCTKGIRFTHDFISKFVF